MAALWQPRWSGLLLWVVLALSPVRHALEATMTAHMLLQMPLLGLSGWWMSAWLAPGFIRLSARWNHRGIAGLILASLVALVWMVPRALDAALNVQWVTAAKFLSIPLLIGLPLAISWPSAGFVVRGLFLLETVATAFRLGWLFLAAPEQLCSNYLLGDQQQLGWMLLAAGAAMCLVLVSRLMWGRFDGPGARSGH